MSISAPLPHAFVVEESVVVTDDYTAGKPIGAAARRIVSVEAIVEIQIATVKIWDL